MQTALLRRARQNRLAIWLLIAFLQFAIAGLASRRADAQGTADDYQRSASYAARTSDRVFADSVNANWFGDGDSHFWYRVDRGPERHRYVLVDCESASRSDAFDHSRLAELLTEASQTTVDADRLDLQGLRFADEITSCTFRFAERTWEFTLPAGPLRTIADEVSNAARAGLKAEPQIARSRDGGERTPIRFENRLDRDLEYFWVMPDGKLRSYGRVGAGKTAQIETYEGHAWLLKDDENKAIASFLAAANESLAIIDGTTPVPSADRPRRRDPSRRDNIRPSARSTSPDGKWNVVITDNQLSIVESATQVSVDIALPVIHSESEETPRLEDRVWWSPDSSHVLLMQVEPGESRTIHLIESSPEDSIHSRLLTVPYAKPGDRLDHPRLLLVSFDQTWTARTVDDTEFPNPFEISEVDWSADSSSFSFLYNERGHQRLRLISVDAKSLTPHVVIDEQSATFVCYSHKTFLHRIAATNELIWMSERSGWNHLYLIDALTGQVKNPITSGSWVVRGVERVDDERRQIYLQVSGIDPDQDPYHVHLIRANYDGGQVVRLTEGDGNHRWRFSPDDAYLIDTYSRVDLPPVTELREVSSGRKLCDLEQADISRLLEIGWRAPERFVAKGRDGVTDIHGIIVRPTNFQADKKYPVLEEIYAGPQSSFVPKSFGLHSSLYEMAELGFIVVKIDGMGTSDRSKSFHDVCWQNLADSGFPDRIAWIKAAAENHPEMDLSRVGIWGGSAGGQSAMRALIAHGDFYHAAVADCGCHDNRVDKIWWNEQWMGWPIGPHYEEQSNATQAHRLQGDLLLIWGELDQNVDPASTMQVIDALVRADKDFEQLIVPGSGHGAAGHPYARRRQADFFVRKLWQREPRSAPREN
jgi:dipeptidyl aminopeptidase/acylaminoacyl peptidase